MADSPTWAPFDSFGVPDKAWDDAPEQDGVKWLHLSSRRPRSDGDRSATWLRWAMAALGLLAATAAAVSFQAQFTMVLAAKGVPWVAALEAGIPDAAAMVFACLGIALALHGKRAIRARVLNVGAVATSVTMNAIAAGPGWRDWAIWIMPPVAYALASDTLIGVVRAHAIAQQRPASELCGGCRRTPRAPDDQCPGTRLWAPGAALADDDATPLAVLTGVLLWTLRLTLAPLSTLTGFRTWVVDECPVAPGRRAEIMAPATVCKTSPVWTSDNFACPDCASVVSLTGGSCASCGWPQDDSTEYCPDCQAVLDFPADSCTACGWSVKQVNPMQCQALPFCPNSFPCPDHPVPPLYKSKTARFLEIVERHHGPFADYRPGRRRHDQPPAGT